MDLYIGVFHFTASFHAQATFHFFFTPALWFFILYSVLDYRLLSYLWMKRNENALMNLEGNGYRNQLQIFNCKFMAATFLLWVLISNFMDSQIAPVIYSLILLPQIVFQIVKGFTIETDYSVTLVFAFSRFIIYLYYRGCPQNTEEVATYPLTCGLIMALIALQLFVMKIQEEYGPDSILPNFCLRGKFNYFVSIKPQGKKNFECELQTGELFSDDLTTVDSKDTTLALDQTTGELVDPKDEEPEEESLCAICMTDIHQEADIPFDEKITSKPFIKRLQRMKDKVMVTPCKHEFHIPCLINWMQIKMECPSCRKELPSY